MWSQNVQDVTFTTIKFDKQHYAVCDTGCNDWSAVQVQFKAPVCKKVCLLTISHVESDSVIVSSPLNLYNIYFVDQLPF